MDDTVPKRTSMSFIKSGIASSCNYCRHAIEYPDSPPPSCRHVPISAECNLLIPTLDKL